MKKIPIKIVKFIDKSGNEWTRVPHFLISDYWTLDRIGIKRVKFIYRFKDLIIVRIIKDGWIIY